VVLYTLRWRGEGEVVRDKVWVLFNDSISWIGTGNILVINPALCHCTTKGAGTKFLITKFLITKFLMHKIPNELNS